MRKLTFLIIAFFMPVLVLAGGGRYSLDHLDLNLSNKAALKRGAKYYVNYCMGCHALAYQRYNRLAQDLGLDDREVEENLIFTSNDKGSPTKVGELMKIAMPADYANKAFGVVPPDLSLIVRSRSADWLYTYLRAFYSDDSRPLGVNNAVFPDVGMPHALLPLQGLQEPVYETVMDHETGKPKEVIAGFRIIKAGKLNQQEYDQLVSDLTHFLAYVSEPARLVRGKVGFWVFCFLLLFTAATYLLKKEYWRDVH